MGGGGVWKCLYSPIALRDSCGSRLPDSRTRILTQFRRSAGHRLRYELLGNLRNWVLRFIREQDRPQRFSNDLKFRSPSVGQAPPVVSVRLTSRYQLRRMSTANQSMVHRKLTRCIQKCLFRMKDSTVPPTSPSEPVKNFPFWISPLIFHRTNCRSIRTGWSSKLGELWSKSAHDNQLITCLRKGWHERSHSFANR